MISAAGSDGVSTYTIAASRSTRLPARVMVGSRVLGELRSNEVLAVAAWRGGVVVSEPQGVLSCFRIDGTRSEITVESDVVHFIPLSEFSILALTSRGSGVLIYKFGNVRRHFHFREFGLENSGRSPLGHLLLQSGLLVYGQKGLLYHIDRSFCLQNYHIPNSAPDTRIISAAFSRGVFWLVTTVGNRVHFLMCSSDFSIFTEHVPPIAEPAFMAPPILAVGDRIFSVASGIVEFADGRWVSVTSDKLLGEPVAIHRTGDRVVAVTTESFCDYLLPKS